MDDSARKELEMLADVLGCKWMIQILQQLEGGPMRPSQIRRAVAGISEKVLAERL
ncbi:MAG: transcriptional regulator, partial [Acidobacteria bacterium]